MSLLWNISKPKTNSIKNGILSVNAYYSRRSSSKDFESFYKNVKSKKDREESQKKNHRLDEGPNWEIFAPTDYRFCLPGSLGPAWQNSNTTISMDSHTLSDLIDFKSKNPKKLHIYSKKCPELLRTSLRDILPRMHMDKSAFTIITLSYHNDTDVENVAKNFVIAAHEICKRLRLLNYWADFMNPFSGKPFYATLLEGDDKFSKIDKHFRSLGVKVESQNNCLVISSDKNALFTGNIFTNAPEDLGKIRLILSGYPMLAKFQNYELDDMDNDVESEEFDEY